MGSINENTILNLGAYEIGTGLIGAPMFLAYMGFESFSKAVAGKGTITQATAPPLNLKTELYGTYKVQKSGKIKVTAIGYPLLKPLKPGTIKKGIKPNVRLEMTLASNQITGIASYSYLDASSKWVTIKNVPVNKKQIIPRPVDLLLVIDIAAVLASQCTTNNVCVISTQGSGNIISCTDDQSLIWSIDTIAPSGEVSISSFSGEMVTEGICVPRKKENYWEGTINANGKTGEICYTINFLVENNPYSYNMSFILK